jgi:uncharacterized protein (TIRG00374 family)
MDEVTTHSRATPPVVTANSTPEDAEHDEMPSGVIDRRKLIGSLLFVVAAIAFFYFVLPKIADLGEAIDRLREGNTWWLALAVLFEICSFGGYVWLFRTVFIRGETRIGWRESYQITMAGLAATRLFAAAGAGGVVLTAWALRRSGMEARIVACRMVAFLVLLYAVFMAALFVDGILLRTGVLPGEAPWSLTVVPSVFAGIAIVVFLLLSFLPSDVERVARRQYRSERVRRIATRVATAPASVASGTRTAINLLRSGEPGVLGAVLWWGFDIAVLWACFHAFGEPPPMANVVMGYFIGLLGNLLPLPGGVGGVEGGMIAAFLAFGVDGSTAVAAVLAYRTIAFWLPTIPGGIAYLSLRKTVHRWDDERAAERAPAVA